jgi:hypothetical protein
MNNDDDDNGSDSTEEYYPSSDDDDDDDSDDVESVSDDIVTVIRSYKSNDGYREDGYITDIDSVSSDDNNDEEDDDDDDNDDDDNDDDDDVHNAKNSFAHDITYNSICTTIIVTLCILIILSLILYNHDTVTKIIKLMI